MTESTHRTGRPSVSLCRDSVMKGVFLFAVIYYLCCIHLLCFMFSICILQHVAHERIKMWLDNAR